MNARLRNIAWAIAEAWWRKQHRVAAGFVPEAESSEAYADRFWEGWVDEAQAALSAMEPVGQPGLSGSAAEARRQALERETT
jgi:hypothetical protein